MPSFEQSITAGMLLSLSIYVGEYLVDCNEQPSFNLSEINHPNELISWPITNALSYAFFVMPKPVISVLKLMLPVTTMLCIIDYLQTSFPQQNNHAPNVLDEYNPFMKDFLLSLSKRDSIEKQADALQLTADENEKLDEYADSISNERVDTPVSLYGRLYSLKTLLAINPRIDPFTRFPYGLRDIQPETKVFDSMNDLLKDFRDKRSHPSPGRR